MIRSSFNPATFDWELDWPGRVARHDVVYSSPPEDPLQGIPLGNGEVAALAWCEGSRLILVVNKSDLWDDGPEGRFHNWAAEEEEFSTTLRHGCRLVLDFRQPVFDSLYLSEVNGRLSLADATLRLQVQGPFGQVDVQAFIGEDDGMLRGRVTASLQEESPLEVTLERYGSRAFGHWYSLINRDASLGLSGTESVALGREAILTHRLTTGTFGVGLRVQSEQGEWSAQREHSRSVCLRPMPGHSHAFSFALAITSPLAVDAVEAVRVDLDAAERRGWEVAYQAHAAAWKAFWLRSLLETENDYLDNLWHLTMYYAKSSQGGRYPGRFIHGLWGWSRDVQPWTFYFHWNQQQTYWPLNPAGHHELIESYLDYRFRALPHNREDAAELFGAEGAFVADVAERRGYNSAGEKDNHTPVAQIAMDFWRQYQYTGDPAFLRERALPYILEAATFFESLLEQDAQGVYHARRGTGYEGWIQLRDAISELIYARVLLRTALEALEEAGADHPRAAHWRQAIANLAPLPAIQPEDCFTTGEDGVRLKRGFFKGQPAPTDRILAAGWSVKDGTLMTGKVPSDVQSPPIDDICEALFRLEQNQTPYSWVREDLAQYDGIFPCLEISAAFPSGLVSVGQRGTELYDLTAATALLYSPDCTGWDTLPIVLARLGLGSQVAAILHNWPIRWQPYANGFGQWGPLDVMRADTMLRFRTNRVRDAALPPAERDATKLPLSMWPFRHMAMESMSVLSCAMNEVLLQSHDGVLRVAPAASTETAGRFTLHAVGGFAVSAELRSSVPAFVAIDSRLGKRCTVQNPWPVVRLYRQGQPVRVADGEMIEFDTAPGDRWLLLPVTEELDNWEVVVDHVQPNAAPKVYAEGRARLGLPRMY